MEYTKFPGQSDQVDLHEPAVYTDRTGSMELTQIRRGSIKFEPFRSVMLSVWAKEYPFHDTQGINRTLKHPSLDLLQPQRLQRRLIIHSNGPNTHLRLSPLIHNPSDSPDSPIPKPQFSQQFLRLVVPVRRESRKCL
jgi:hypothetical protein